MGPKQFYDDGTDQKQKQVLYVVEDAEPKGANGPLTGTARKGISQRNLAGVHRRAQQDQEGFFSWSKLWQGIDCRGGHASCGGETDVGYMLNRVDQNQVLAEMPGEYNE